MAGLHAESFDRPWDALEMARHLQTDLCLGMDQSGELDAFVILSVAADQAEILTIATAKSARRQGLGRAVLDLAETELSALGVKEIYLEVAEDNAPAVALYRGAGFTPIGRRPGYYRREAGRIAALTFSKKL